MFYDDIMGTIIDYVLLIDEDPINYTKIHLEIVLAPYLNASKYYTKERRRAGSIEMCKSIYGGYVDPSYLHCYMAYYCVGLTADHIATTINLIRDTYFGNLQRSNLPVLRDMARFLARSKVQPHGDKKGFNVDESVNICLMYGRKFFEEKDRDPVRKFCQLVFTDLSTEDIFGGR
jgi:hypothetical protein